MGWRNAFVVDADAAPHHRRLLVEPGEAAAFHQRGTVQGAQDRHAQPRQRLADMRFLAAASHDLLQPLSAAKLFVASLEDRIQDPASREIADKAVG